MFIRNANPWVRSAALSASIWRVPAVALAIACSAAPSAAQDAAALLDTLRQSMAKDMPAQVRVTASGSGYTAGSPSGRQHYRIESYVQEIDIAGASATERLVRPDAPAASGAQQATTPAAGATGPGRDEQVLWTTPLGFLAAAASGPVTLGTETVFGTPYQVLTVTMPGGRQVRGYVSSENVLERTRTEVGKVPVEAVFMSWQDFGGVRFPSLIIRNENGQLSEILVVSALDRTGGADGKDTQAKRSDG